MTPSRAHTSFLLCDTIYHQPSLQTTLAQRAIRAACFTLVVLALLYAADYLCFRYRVPANRQTLGSVEIHRYYALHKSRTKTNFVFAEPENQVCVHALFPHSGHPPCWYLSRHSEQRIDYD